MSWLAFAKALLVCHSLFCLIEQKKPGNVPRSISRRPVPFGVNHLGAAPFYATIAVPQF